MKLLDCSVETSTTPCGVSQSICSSVSVLQWCFGAVTLSEIHHCRLKYFLHTVLTAKLSLRHLGVLIRSTAELQLGADDIYGGLDADSTHGFACKCHIVRSVWAAGVNGSPVCPEAVL